MPLREIPRFRNGKIRVGVNFQQPVRAVRVLDQAEQIAQKAGDSYVTVERLLLALVILGVVVVRRS